MGHLLHIALAIAALVFVELAPFPTRTAPWLVALLLFLPHALTAVSRRCFLRGRFTTGLWLARAARASPPLSYLVALALGGWATTVERWTGREVSLFEWPGPSVFVLLAPFVAYEILAIDAHARCVAHSGRDARALRNLQLRMFVSALVPLSIYVLAAACIGANEELRVNVEEVALFHALFAGLLLVGLAVSLPTLLRVTWDTAPIPHGEQRAVLDAVAARARFQSRDILVWNTGHSLANAAIVGIGRRRRIVFFSDALLAQLAPRELAAVFAHEIGHALRHHIPVFGAWAIGFFLAADYAIRVLVGDDGWPPVVAIAGALACWYFLFGYLSRRFELDADLFGVELLHDPVGLVLALERVGGHFRDVASWRHFSTARRVEFIQRAAADPGVGSRLRRTIRRMKILGVLLLAVAVSLEARDVVRALGEDRVRVDLRLGRYTSAQERAHGRAVDPSLAALVLRSKSLSGSDASTDEIEKRARTALESGDVDAGLQWLELGVMRGRRELDVVASAVNALASGESDELGEEIEREPLSRWRAELDAVRDAARTTSER